MDNLTQDFIENTLTFPEEADLTHYNNEEISLYSEAFRNKRDRLLKETDWWAVSDRTMTQAEIDYRQALRDVPAQEMFPVHITWPTKP